jgi:hypothetical protein
MSPGTPNCPVFVLCPAFVPCSFIIHFKGSVTNLGQIKAQATRSRIWRRLASKLHEIVWRPGRRGQRGFRTPGFQFSRKSGPTIRAQFDARMHQNSPTSICIFKNFPGLYPEPPRRRGGMGRGGEGGAGEGGERAGNSPGLGQQNYGHLIIGDSLTVVNCDL